MPFSVDFSTFNSLLILSLYKSLVSLTFLSFILILIWSLWLILFSDLPLHLVIRYLTYFSLRSSHLGVKTLFFLPLLLRIFVELLDTYLLNIGLSSKLIKHSDWFLNLISELNCLIGLSCGLLFWLESNASLLF